MQHSDQRGKKPTVVGPFGEEVYEHLQGEKQSVAFVRIPPGGRSEMHFHQEVEEVYMVTSGLGELHIGFETTLLNPGCTALIERHDAHKIVNVGGDSWLEFWVTCAEPWTPDCMIPVDESG